MFILKYLVLFCWLLLFSSHNWPEIDVVDRADKFTTHKNTFHSDLKFKPAICRW